MKKKILFLVTGILCLAGLFFSCAADSSGDSGSSGPVKGSVVYNVRTASNTEKIILGWQVPAANYFGVQVSMTPAEGTLTSPKKCAKNETSLLVEGLNANTEYSFTFTALDSEGNLGSETTTIQIKTAETTAPDTTPPAEVTNLKLKVADGIAKLTWIDSVSEDVFGYEITYDKQDIEYATGRSVFEQMAANTVFVSPGTQKYEFEVDTGKEYSFTIKAVDTSGNKSEGQTLSKKLMDVIEPKPFATRTENLDLIFGTDSAAEITLTIDRTEWDTLLENYDINPKNEDCIHADFEMTKGGYTWQAENIGMRIRGNTSRIRPQQGDKYYQAHFKIDFEEWIEDDTIEEGKLAGCMKGIILKRFKDDPTYVREVFGYNFFRKNGIWTAPRAGYTRLFINIVEDGGETTELDYGVYAMIEEINKQFLKERSEITPEIGTKFNGNKGNLWKCCWQSSNGPSMATDFDAYRSFGVEEIFLDEEKSMRYDYDLKTNKDDLISARDEFIDFIYKLKELSTVEEIKAFYTKKMDVDLFLKTYACNVLLGMDDDYWNNKNNYYFYFDKKGKCYFIPYDYDNILGTNCFDDTATKNPLKWSENGYKVPLIEKLLSVPEYKKMYVEYLLELSEETSFVTGSQTEIQRLQDLIRSYTDTKDITFDETYSFSKVGDGVGRWCTNYKAGRDYTLVGGSLNYFETKAKSIADYTEAQVTFNLNAPDGKTVTLIDENGIPHVTDYFASGLASEPVYDFYIYCEGYNFEGWYDAADGVNLVSTMPSGETTLYAHWSPKAVYQITFKLNGGTSSSITDGETIEFYDGKYLPNSGIINETDNAFFIGWYDAADGGNQVEYATSNMTVYAHYHELPYKYWTDESSVIHLSFAFNPEDYFGLSADEDYEVIHACGLSGWGNSTVVMQKGSDGVYRCEYTSNKYEISSMWPGYKFIVDGIWIGPYDGYRYRSYLTPMETYENKPQYNFLIEELMANYK